MIFVFYECEEPRQDSKTDDGEFLGLSNWLSEARSRKHTLFNIELRNWLRSHSKKNHLTELLSRLAAAAAAAVIQSNRYGKYLFRWMKDSFWGGL